jgi:hypothetical protein
MSSRKASARISHASERAPFSKRRLIPSRFLEPCGIIILRIASRVDFRWWELSANFFVDRRRKTNSWKRLFCIWLFSISWILILKLILILIRVSNILYRERTKRWFRSNLIIIRIIKTRFSRRIRNKSRRRIWIWNWIYGRIFEFRCVSFVSLYRIITKSPNKYVLNRFISNWIFFVIQ